MWHLCYERHKCTCRGKGMRRITEKCQVAVSVCLVNAWCNFPQSVLVPESLPCEWTVLTALELLFWLNNTLLSGYIKFSSSIYLLMDTSYFHFFDIWIILLWILMYKFFCGCVFSFPLYKYIFLVGELLDWMQFFIRW